MPIGKTFYSHGKLLLTGEYFILAGATGLALPTVFGQSLKISPSTDRLIRWKSFDENGKTWFESSFNPEDFSSPNKDKVTATLSKILQEAKNLNPHFLVEEYGKNIETRLEFSRHWGLGSSSTLINNIAQWAEVDPFILLEKSFGGSGYDIAAAGSKKPILYSKNENQPVWEEVKLKWNFFDSLFFVYLNQKQDSREGIRRFQKAKPDLRTAERISVISRTLPETIFPEDFESLLNEHEELVSESLALPTVKSSLFPDYPKTIKSLGAWGGDFILATGGEAEKQYFSDKGYQTILSFKKMTYPVD